MGNRPSWPRGKEDRREDHSGPEGGPWGCRVDGEVEKEMKSIEIGIDSMVVAWCVVVEFACGVVVLVIRSPFRSSSPVQ